MCGITGVFSPENMMELHKFYEAHLMIKHRGPDDEGFVALDGREIVHYKGKDTISDYWDYPDISQLTRSKLVLGHRRLSIIDLSPAGHQPLVFENLAMVFNGEVFNYIELRGRLFNKGYTFLSSSDTEVVLKAYHCWGEDCFNMFNGMWALAIYNREDNSLILSRDRFGQKPLYYYTDNNFIVFSSENKFIRKYNSISLGLNEKYLTKYIETSISDDSKETCFKDIFELEPGHFLKFGSQGVDIHKYWQFKPSYKPYSDDQALQEFAYLFNDSLKLRMRSDVPVGALLSGGLDSTLIVCSLYALGFLEELDFQTFSAVFHEEQYSEKKYIDATRKKTGILSDFIYPKPDDVQTYLTKILYHIEMPFRSLAVLSQHLIYRRIGENSKIKVVLNGQGADEAFGGYTADLYHVIVAFIGQGKLKEAVRLIRLVKNKRNITKKQILGSLVKRFNIGMTNPAYYNHASYSQITTSALREYLKYDDRNSMAYGIEARAPFVDYRLMEFAFNIDVKFKENKKIIRDFSEEHITKEVLERKDKMGFISPQELWQNHELKGLINDTYKNYNLNDFSLNIKHEKAILDGYQSGKNNDWARVWRVFCTLYWLSQDYNSNMYA